MASPGRRRVLAVPLDPPHLTLSLMLVCYGKRRRSPRRAVEDTQDSIAVCDVARARLPACSVGQTAGALRSAPPRRRRYPDPKPPLRATAARTKRASANPGFAIIEVLSTIKGQPSTRNEHSKQAHNKDNTTTENPTQEQRRGFASSQTFRASCCLLRMNIQRKPGDWNCKNCQHLNFSRRDYCQRCRDPRPDLQFSDGYSTGGVLTSLDIRPGDWYCSCGYHNFASRSSCFKCGTIVRDFPAGQGAAGAEGDFAQGRDSATVRAGWKAGDWICTRPGCNVHNFASRTECYRCNAPREAVGTGN